MGDSGIHSYACGRIMEVLPKVGESAGMELCGRHLARCGIWGRGLLSVSRGRTLTQPYLLGRAGSHMHVERFAVEGGVIIVMHFARSLRRD